MKHTIISIGEVLWDILPDKTLLGGAPANLAFRLNELGEDCLFISRVGRDKLGEEAVYMLKEMGLSTALIQWDDNLPTGTVEVSFDEYKNPDYVIIPQVAYDRMELTGELKDAAGNCRCIAFGTLAQRAEKSGKTITELLEIAKDAIKFLDINLRKDCYTEDSIRQSLHYADILKANHHEAYQISRIYDFHSEDVIGICKEISEKFKINKILVTLEEKGVFLFDTDEGGHYIPGYSITMEDPLGAGDAFSAGFISALLEGRSMVESSEKGNQLGALAARKKGATQQITPEELKDMIHENNRIIDQNFINYLFLPQH